MAVIAARLPHPKSENIVPSPIREHINIEVLPESPLQHLSVLPILLCHHSTWYKLFSEVPCTPKVSNMYVLSFI